MSAPSGFNEFFRTAFGKAGDGGFQPFGYQSRLACGERYDCLEAEWLKKGTRCESKLINIPIPRSRDKTAAIVLAWLWNRIALPEASRPSRSICASILAKSTKGDDTHV